jgi:hypothetical protein
MAQWNVTKCESCGGEATRCCAREDQPMLWFCDKCYRIHIREAHK